MLESRFEEQFQETIRDQIDRLNQRAWENFSSQPRQALELARQALELARQEGYDVGRANAWRELAAAHWMLSDFVPAITCARDALNLYQTLNDRRGEFEILTILAAIYGDLSEYERSLDYQLKALRLAEELDYQPGVGQALFNIGEIYYLTEQFQQALEYKLKALELDEALNVLSHYAANLSSIGDIYLKLENTEAALAYQLRALKAVQEVSSPYELAHVYRNLGNIYARTQQYREALPHLSRALSLFEELDNKVGLGAVLIQLGDVYTRLGQDELALANYRRALEIGQETQARDLSYQIHAAFSKFYEAKGNYAKALEHYKLFSEIKDEVFNRENQKAIAGLQIRFDIEKAEKEREIFRLRNVELAAANREIAELNEQLKNEIRVVKRELEIGRQIQADFLPESLPALPGWELAFHFKPAREVSGDFYDAFTLPGGRVALVIADVCDKGVGAALFMSLTRSLVRVLSQQASFRIEHEISPEFSPTRLVELPGAKPLVQAPADVVEYLNTITLVNSYITANHQRANMFATLFFAVLDTKTGQLCYVNAGHDAPVYLGKNGLKGRLKLTGPAVGAIEGIVYRMGQVQLEPGDLLFSYTDGVTEANNPAGEVFTEERLLDLIEDWQAHKTPGACSLLNLVNANVTEHVAGAEASDDVTMLAIYRQMVD
jgi:sigma-B regulation protein RsbU (phosphoserine phosphatase)